MKIREGKATIEVPKESLTRKSEAFYNPSMGYQRNITISALSVYSKGKGSLEILDPLAATGVRGIRILKEVKNVKKVHLNDLNPKAVSLIRKNLTGNRIPKKKYEITKKDANVLMLENRKQFDFVDIDPFGSPVHYLKNADACLKPKSLLAVTATDTGALCGSFPEACMRRYGIAVSRTPFPKELGVRVLAAAVMKNLAPYDLSFRPLYSHSNHYIRIIGTVEESVKKVDESLGSIQMFYYSEDGRKGPLLGPIWMGSIQDREFVNDLFHDFVSRGFKPTKELQIAMEEIDLPFYYDLHGLSKSVKKGSPNMERIIKKLREKGYRASRTHLEFLGLKTDAPEDEILRMV